MGLQINSQPQNFKSSVVIGDGLSAVSGLTVYGSLSASSNLHASSISAGNVTALAGGKFYGDGSGLTNINAGNLQGFSGVTSVNTLTGDITNVVFTGSANNFTGVNTFSQTTNFQAITGTTGNFSGNLSVSGTVLSSGQNLIGIFGEKGKTDSVFSTVQTITGTGLSTTNLTGSNGNFVSLTASNLSAGNYLSGGQNLTGIFGEKSKTDSVFSTVQSITGTGLNTSNLTASNGTFTSLSAGNYLSGGQNLTGIFGEKGKTDSVFSSVQTYSAGDWTVGKSLSTGGSTPTIGYRFLNNNPAVYGDLTIYGRINALSGATFTDTTFTTTSSLCVYNKMNTGAALYVGASGSGDIASFYDIDGNVEVLHVGGATGSFPGVGIRVSNPTKTLTLSGDLSASGEVYASKYFLNNIDISSTYNTVNTGSAKWNTAYSQITSGSLSAAGVGFTVGVSLSTPSLTAGSATFRTSLSAASYQGSGSTLTGVVTGLYGTIPANGNLTTVLTSINSVAGTNGNFANVAVTNASNTFANAQTFSTSISSPAISGTHYGSGANLTNISLPAAGTFSTSVSSPAISAVNFYGNTVAPVTNQSATFTLSLANAGGIIRIGPAASNTQVYVNVPTNASVPFPIGTQTILAQVSAATVTVSATAGVTLLSYQSKTSLAAQNSVASLIKTGTDEWLLAGDIN